MNRLLVFVQHIKNIENEILDMFVASGALLQGHFKLESGQHSSLFTRFADIAGNSLFARKIAERLIDELKRDGVVIDSVLTQESAGRVIGDLIANKLGKRIVVVETDDHNRPTTNIVNETTLYPGDNVLIVIDLAKTGSSLRTMVSLVRNKKAQPCAIAIFATRNKEALSEFERRESIKIYALVDLALGESTYGIPGKDASEEDCEICRQGKPSIPSWQI